jgi:peptidoglycan hydrolase CwlO-like protein
VACATVLPARPASAVLPSQLETARKRVAELEARISRQEANVASLQQQLRSLSTQVGREQGGLDVLRRDITSTRTRIAETKARLQTLRDQLRSRARTVYMRGPLEMIGVLLGSESIGDFIGRITYAAQLARHDGQLVGEARAAHAKLRDQQAQQERLEREQASKVASLRSRQNALANVFIRQQLLMAELARSRAEALRLVAELKDRIAAGELGNLLRVAGHGMTIGYGEWARSFLVSLGAPVVRSNLVAVVAWQAAEGTMATWNPLATTFYMPGSTVYNSYGVRNYESKTQGIEASILTLGRPGHGYEAIVSSLKGGAESMDTGRAINRSDWCRGCAGGTYVIGFIPAVERYYDRFAG